LKVFTKWIDMPSTGDEGVVDPSAGPTKKISYGLSTCKLGHTCVKTTITHSPRHTHTFMENANMYISLAHNDICHWNTLI
jgi:hypothetical protein